MIGFRTIMETINGSIQLRSGEVRQSTLNALMKRGFHWRSCGGWTAISRPDVECPEPGSHIFEHDLGLIIPVIATMPEGFGYWDLYWAVKKLTNDHFKCCAPFDAAVRYGVRKGMIERADWMSFIL